MSCNGCSNAIKRILRKINGVTIFDINNEKTLVTVFHNKDIVTEQLILNTLKKWGTASGKNVEIFQEKQNLNTPSQITSRQFSMESPSNSPPNSPSNFSSPYKKQRFSEGRLNKITLKVHKL